MTDAPEMAVWSEDHGMEPAGPHTPCDGPAEYLRIDKVEALRAENEKVDDFWEVANATLATENAQLRRLLRRVHEEFWDWQDESAENWATYEEIDRVLNHPRSEEKE